MRRMIRGALLGSAAFVATWLLTRLILGTVLDLMGDPLFSGRALNPYMGAHLLEEVAEGPYAPVHDTSRRSWRCTHEGTHTDHHRPAGHGGQAVHSRAPSHRRDYRWPRGCRPVEGRNSQAPYLEEPDIAEALSYAAWHAEEIEVPPRAGVKILVDMNLFPSC